ncbi:hypothetical protein vseg_002287 [Gypsophila vaccaria]
MSQFPDLLRDNPDLRRTRPHSTRLPGTTPLSDPEPEPEPDFDIDVDVESPPLSLEPLFSAFPDEIDHHHHHRFRHHDVSFPYNNNNNNNNDSSFSHRADIGPYFGPGWADPPRSYAGEGGSEVNLELGLGLGFGDLGNSSQNNNHNFDEMHRFEGLRVVNLDSGSDSEDAILRDFDYDYDHNDDHQGFGGVSDFDRPPFCWDYLGFNNRNRDHLRGDGVEEGNEGGNGGGDDDFLYDGGDEDDGEGEGEGYVEEDEGDNVDTGVSILFDAYQEREEQREIVIESDDDDQGGDDFGVEDAIRDLEWEILMAVNNFNREVYDMDFNVDMYEAILGEVEDRMNEWRGSPPASDAVIHNLPSVNLSTEVVCTICRDEVLVQEVVRQLPCLHCYHGDCIVPWLKIRNTCPVCRYELPTDDAEYECRKRERDGADVDAIDLQLTLDSQVSSYDYHVFL